MELSLCQPYFFYLEWLLLLLAWYFTCLESSRLGAFYISFLPMFWWAALVSVIADHSNSFIHCGSHNTFHWMDVYCRWNWCIHSQNGTGSHFQYQLLLYCSWLGRLSRKISFASCSVFPRSRIARTFSVDKIKVSFIITNLLLQYSSILLCVCWYLAFSIRKNTWR